LINKFENKIIEERKNPVISISNSSSKKDVEKWFLNFSPNEEGKGKFYDLAKYFKDVDGSILLGLPKDDIVNVLSESGINKFVSLGLYYALHPEKI